MFFIGVIFVLVNLVVLKHADSWMLNHRKYLDENMTDVYSYVLSAGKEVYYLADERKTDYHVKPKYLQFMLLDKPIHLTSDYKSINATDDYILLTESSLKTIREDGFELVVTSNMLNAYYVLQADAN